MYLFQTYNRFSGSSSDIAGIWSIKIKKFKKCLINGRMKYISNRVQHRCQCIIDFNFKYEFLFFLISSNVFQHCIYFIVHTDYCRDDSGSRRLSLRWLIRYACRECSEFDLQHETSMNGWKCSWGFHTKNYVMLVCSYRWLFAVVSEPVYYFPVLLAVCTDAFGLVGDS